MYEIEFTDTAKRQFTKLERSVQERISAVLDRIKIRPEAYLERLVGVNSYKLRVGGHRLIIDLDNKKLIILVLKVAHRKNVYDKL